MIHLSQIHQNLHTDKKMLFSSRLPLSLSVSHGSRSRYGHKEFRLESSDFDGINFLKVYGYWEIQFNADITKESKCFFVIILRIFVSTINSVMVRKDLIHAGSDCALIMASSLTFLNIYTSQHKLRIYSRLGSIIDIEHSENKIIRQSRLFENEIRLRKFQSGI